MSRPDSSRPGTPRASRAVGHLLGGFFYWLPVWAPLTLLAQIGTLGLRPALAESHRLERCERALGERLAEALEERDELEALNIALADPIYRERLRLHRIAAATQR